LKKYLGFKMLHFKKMKLVPFNTPPAQQVSIKPFTQPTEVSLEKNINEKNEILSSNAPPTRKNSSLNRNIQSFKVLAKNILNKTENKKKSSLKLRNSGIKRKPLKLENSQMKKIKLEEESPIISDIKPTPRRSGRIKNKSKLGSYKKSFSSKVAHSSPKISWLTT